MTLPHFFRQCSPLTSPFVVFSYGSRPGGANIYLQRLWDEKHISPMQAALDQLAPFEWDNFESYSGIRGTRTEKCYLFGNHLWTLTKSDKSASEDERRLLFLDALDKDRLRFERLKKKFSGDGGVRISERREPIAEEVRVYVWRRDNGRCVRCGSQERLEYDHIIPVIKGGSSTARNIQLLCEPCNRQKTDRI